jgi:hypothetical protein
MPSIWPWKLLQAHGIPILVAYQQFYNHVRDGQFAFVTYADLITVVVLSPGGDLLSLRAPPVPVVVAQGVDGYEQRKASEVSGDVALVRKVRCGMTTLLRQCGVDLCHGVRA